MLIRSMNRRLIPLLMLILVLVLPPHLAAREEQPAAWTPNAVALTVERRVSHSQHPLIPAEGLHLDVMLSIRNDAGPITGLVVTDTVPLIAPLVGLEDQTSILGRQSGETLWVRNEPFFYPEPSEPFIPPASHQAGQTLGLADWRGEYAVFDVPTYGEIERRPAADGNYITIPPEYTRYISITTDHKLLLPVLTLTWRLPALPAAYSQPALRYGIHSRELLGRELTVSTDPGAGGVVIQAPGGSVYTHLGQPAQFTRNVLSQAQIYTAQGGSAPSVSYRDGAGLTQRVPLAASFYDVYSLASCASCGPGTSHPASDLTVTFGLRADLDRDGQRDEPALLYPGRLAGADLDVVIKSRQYKDALLANDMVLDLGLLDRFDLPIEPRSGSWSTSWQSNQPGTSLALVRNDGASKSLVFQHNGPVAQTVAITLAARISDGQRLIEGPFVLHQGAQFITRQIDSPTARYQRLAAAPQGLLAAATELTVNKRVVPLKVRSSGDTIYYIFTIDDPADPRAVRRNSQDDGYVQSYGWTDRAATVSLGGRHDKQILHSLVRPGERTRLRVELANNTAQIWRNVTVTPQTPAGVTVTPVYTETLPARFIADRQFINADTIDEAQRGVYEYEVILAADYSGERGVMLALPISVSAEGAPEDLQIPPAMLGVVDAADGVRHGYGRAKTLSLSDRLPSYVTLQDAAMVSAADVDALLKAPFRQDRAQVFAGFTHRLPFSVDVAGTAQFSLPGGALDRLYAASGDHRLLVIAQAAISPPGYEPISANNGAQITYRDPLDMEWTATAPGVLVSVLRDTFLPLLRRAPAVADLVVTKFTVSPEQPEVGKAAQIEVVVTNRGTKPAGDFWVDFYISPDPVPTKAGLRWNDACAADIAPCDGVAWYVNGLAPGASATLTSSPQSYAVEQTRWTGGFRVNGSHDLYVLADSWNGANPDGGVVELDEANNLAVLRDIQINGTPALDLAHERPVVPPRSLPWKEQQ